MKLKNDVTSRFRNATLQNKSVLKFFNQSGFTIIETLLVVLVVGILCATGISIYAGVTHDSRVRTKNDSIKAFFSACKHRAKFRKTPIKIMLSNKTLFTNRSTTLRLRIPELTDKCEAQINGITITASQTLSPKGKSIANIPIELKFPGNKIVNLSF